jgi:hypothetical protein
MSSDEDHLNSAIKPNGEDISAEEESNNFIMSPKSALTKGLDVIAPISPGRKGRRRMTV